jgi:hypothetical protein
MQLASRRTHPSRRSTTSRWTWSSGSSSSALPTANQFVLMHRPAAPCPRASWSDAAPDRLVADDGSPIARARCPRRGKGLRLDDLFTVFPPHVAASTASSAIISRRAARRYEILHTTAAGRDRTRRLSVAQGARRASAPRAPWHRRIRPASAIPAAPSEESSGAGRYMHLDAPAVMARGAAHSCLRPPKRTSPSSEVGRSLRTTSGREGRRRPRLRIADGSERKSNVSRDARGSSLASVRCARTETPAHVESSSEQGRPPRAGATAQIRPSSSAIGGSEPSPAQPLRTSGTTIR